MLAALLCAASGCINITEEIFLEGGGGGRYETVIDMRKMMEMMKMVGTMLPDSAREGMPDLSNLNLKDSVQSMWAGMEAVEGISEVRRDGSDDGLMKVSFRFRDIKALNRALAMRSKGGETDGNREEYAFEKGRFTCKTESISGMEDALKGLDEAVGAGKDSAALNVEMLRMMMGDMTYKTVYHLPGGVTDFSNKAAKVSGDGRTVTLTLDQLDNKKPRTLFNEIRYK